MFYTRLTVSFTGLGFEESRSIWLLEHFTSRDDSERRVASACDDCFLAGPK